MPIRKSRPAANDAMWTYFRTALISIDNLAFVVSDFHQIYLTETVSMWCKPQLIPHVKFALYVIEHITMYLNNYIYWHNSEKVVEGSLVSFENKVDHVAISNLQDEVKYIFGFIFYR